ncbi:MAG: DUF1549 domain-containing protein [Planctomycetota bacterium]|nr:MAG: DUF1549 domain-containing protein [Planctomycetota bacterium]
MRVTTSGLILLLALFSAPQTWGQTPSDTLSSVIDQTLAPPSGLTIGVCSDAEFLRRVSLDLIGYPPTAVETRAFLADPAPDKRIKMVDQLLASPRFARHLATAIDLWLMERRPNSNIPQDEWHAWLVKSIREGKPWNVLAREILNADGADPATRPAARFYLDRNSEPNQIVRDVGRIFFGRDLQCAQCHDHPLVDDFKQADYHGLLAFIAPGYSVAIKNGDRTVNIHAEKAGTDLQFESVFYKGTLHRTPPRVPGDLLIDEPNFYPGEEYTVVPADNIQAVPKFSRRQKLAEIATSGTNRVFNENIANRLWSHMFGRGLVHPLDMHHADNPGTNPVLMKALGERFAAMSYDMKGFLREIALSQSYQRPFDAPGDLLTAAAQAAAQLAPLEAERTAAGATYTSAKTAFEQATTAYEAAEKAYLPVVAELDKARTQCAEAKKGLDAANAAVAEAQKQATTKQEIATSLQQAVTAAQAAAQKLPADAELAAAAAKFAERSTQVTGEVAALQKVVEEKTAAVAAPTNAYATSKTAIDVALAATQPLRESLKQKDIELLAARRQMQDQVGALAVIDARIVTTKSLAALATAKQSLDTAQLALAARETEHKAAMEQLVAYAPTVTERESVLKVATDALSAAAVAVQTAQAEQANHLALVKDLTTATEATGAALAKLPGDAVLADASTKLKERLVATQTESAQYQTKVDKASTDKTTATVTRDAAQKLMEEAVVERTRREQVVATAVTAVDTTQSDRTKFQGEIAALSNDAVDGYSKRFALANLKALTPEQLCWSIFQVTDVYGRHWNAEVAELDKAAPLTDAQKQDPAAVAARMLDLEQRTYDKLKGNLSTFIQFYGAGAGQPQSDFFATADQALYAANAGSVSSWCAQTGGNVTDLVVNQLDAKLAAEELYLAVLSRLPTETETAAVADILTKRAADKSVAAQELVWGLVNSAEFRFNH